MIRPSSDVAATTRPSVVTAARAITESLVAGQVRVLDMIVHSAPLRDTLTELVHLVEAQSPDLIGSVLLLDDDGAHVRHGAAPSLPAGYLQAIDGAPIGPKAGSCGTAAYRRERVVVEDIQTDPLWEDYRGLAATYGLRACWSTPIFDPDQRVLGTFALYFEEPASPKDWHFQLIEMATQTAAVAIARTRSNEEHAKLVEARRDHESRIAYLATHDTLTDLPNRSLISDRIAQAIAHARRADRPLAVMTIGLDRFRSVNEGFGREAGDRVLAAVAKRLTNAIADVDTVARLSGDEFVILLSDLRTPGDAFSVAQTVLGSLTESFVTGEHPVHASASIGVSLYPQDGSTADELIASADAAMARAKDAGGNTCQFFTTAMSDDTRRRLLIESELRGAIDRGELHLAFQPRVSLATGAVVGCEALVRWTHPTLGRISPAEFIPIAEDSGLIVPIGDWVLTAACAQARAWMDARLPHLTVSVNLSARQFLQDDVVAQVRNILESTRLPGDRLEIELTESLLAQDIGRATTIINAIKALGLRIAIDDFGTGYSSLSHLKRFGADTLKIDQSFVRNLDSDPDDASITLAVIALAHNLGMTAVAEGVETEAQWRFLWLNRCEEMQGYYFSKPIGAAEFEQMLREGRYLAPAPSRRRLSVM